MDEKHDSTAPTSTATAKRAALLRELRTGRKIPGYEMVSLAGLQYSARIHELRWNIGGCVRPDCLKGVEYGMNIRNANLDPKRPDHTVFWLAPVTGRSRYGWAQNLKSGQASKSPRQSQAMMPGSSGSPHHFLVISPQKGISTLANAWSAFYFADYLADTGHLSLAQHGAYLLLMAHYYRSGQPIPSDPAQLYRICRAFEEQEQAAVRAVVQMFFMRDGDVYRHGRIDKELIRQAEYKARLSAGARKTNQKRWGQSPSESPSGRKPQSQSQKEKKYTPAPDGACERIYQAYPRKVGRKRALKAIAKAIADIQGEKASSAEEAADFLYSQVVKFAESPKGQQGRFTPHPTTWMNDGRYFDDPVEWHTVGSAQSNISRPSDSDFIGRAPKLPPCPVGECDGSGWWMDRQTRRRVTCECQAVKGSTCEERSCSKNHSPQVPVSCCAEKVDNGREAARINW